MIQFKLSTPQEFGAMLQWVRDNVLRAIGHRKWIIVTLESNASPSVVQRSKFHAMLNDVNRQGFGSIGTTQIDMRKYDYDECKTLMVKWFLAEKELNGEELKRSVKPRVILDPLRGDLVYLRPSTTKFDDALVSEFVEFIYAIGAELGVRWTEPAMREYMSYKEFQNG